MGGLGAARGKFKGKDLSSSKNKTTFAWNVGAGVAYNIDSSMKLEVMYKLANANKNFKEKNSSKSKLSGGLDHSVMAGVRYHF
jgi:opacity protein-like surface antigen